MTQSRAILVALALSTAVSGATQVDAADRERFRLTGGAFFIDFDTETTIGAAGATVDLEDDLGMDDHAPEPFLAARWSFARRHSLALAHLSVERDSTTVLGRELQFDDEFLAIGLEVDTRFDWEILTLVYTYQVVSRDKYNVNLTFGLSAVDYDLAVEALAFAKTSAAGSTVDLGEVVREDEEYPVPTFGVGFKYRLTDKWSVGTGAAYFEYGQDDWDVDMLVLDAGVEYFPTRVFGLSAGYSLLDITYEEEGRDTLDISYTYQGALVTAILRF